MKIVHVSSVHPSTDTRVFFKECVSASQHGYDVTLIARAKDDYSSHNVQVRAVKRAPGGRLVRFTRTAAIVARMAYNEQGDLYHLHDAELLPLGVMLRAMGRVVIYDAHEDLSEQVRSKGWIPRLLRPLVSVVAGTVERFAAARCSAVIVANPLQRSRFPRDRTVTVQNFPLMSEVSRFEVPPRDSQRRQCFYVGGLSAIRGIREMVKAIEIVNRTETVELVLGGWFPSRSLETEVKAMDGWRYVRFLGPIDRETLIDELSKTSVGLSVVHPVPNHQTNQPVKLFEYMMAAVPVVVSNIPNYRQFIADRDAGIAVDPLNPVQIADAIISLVRNPAQAREMGRKGRQAVKTEYNWDNEAPKLLDLYEKLLGHGPDVPSGR